MQKKETDASFHGYARSIGIVATKKNAGLASGGRARIPTMYTGGIIGLMGGFCFALQNSSGRLLGLLPNEAEVEEANRRR